MSLRACLFTVTCLAALDAAAQPTIWNGPDLMFSKGAFADPTLPENQDRVTDDVWLTRAAVRGLYNAASESLHDIAVSPAGTEWAYGTTADLGSLTFSPFAEVIGLSGPFGGISSIDPALNVPGSQPAVSDSISFSLTLNREITEADLREALADSVVEFGSDYQYLRAVPAPGALMLLSIAFLAVPGPAQAVSVLFD